MEKGLFLKKKKKFSLVLLRPARIIENSNGKMFNDTAFGPPTNTRSDKLPYMVRNLAILQGTDQLVCTAGAPWFGGSIFMRGNTPRLTIGRQKSKLKKKWFLTAQAGEIWM